MRAALVLAGLAVGATPRGFSPAEPAVSSSGDSAMAAALDTHYQAAVKDNDAAAMAEILADEFVLVTGTGKVIGKAELLEEARSGLTSYEHNEEIQQAVRVWGSTAVVTALLWEKGVSRGRPFDKRLWFSDIYLRTPSGWKYVFGQASLALPREP